MVLLQQRVVVLFQTAFFRFLLLQKRIFIRTQCLFLNQLRVEAFVVDLQVLRTLLPFCTFVF